MLMRFLSSIADHRRKQGRRYQLGHILFFAILAIASNADSYRKIHSFITRHYATLNHLFDLKWKRLPAYTTIRNMIQHTSAAELETQFRAFSRQLAPVAPPLRVVRFDGKVVRGSFDQFHDQSAIQVLSAFLTGAQIILGHEEIAAKTNEIPAAQTLIQALGLADSVLTFDALHCQHETLRIAKATGNEVVVQVKKNQPTLFKDCGTVAEGRTPDASYQEPFTKTRNRVESRRVEVFAAPGLTQADTWHAVAAVIKVTRFRELFKPRTKTWHDTRETAFYIATTIRSPEEFCRIIRGHWGIENRNHYVKDVSMREDHSRIRVNAHIFVKLRSFALNLLRVNGVQNIQRELFENCLNLDGVLNYVGVV